jgi:hypothetical protein
MRYFSIVLASISLLTVLLLQAGCDSAQGIVTVKSDTKATGSVKTDSGLKVAVTGWTGKVITVSDTLEDDAVQIALPGQLTMVGHGFIWIPGGITTSETVLTFPITGTFENGALLDLYWYDTANVRWIPFAGVQGVVEDGFCVITLANGGTGIGDNFAIADTVQQGGTS